MAEKIGRAHELDFVCVQAILARASELPPETLLFLNLTPQTLEHDLLTAPAFADAVEAVGGREPKWSGSPRGCQAGGLAVVVRNGVAALAAARRPRLPGRELQPNGSRRFT